MVNDKVDAIIEASELNESDMKQHIRLFKQTVDSNNTVNFSVGNNGRLRIRDRYAGINYHLFLGYLKQPEIFTLKQNKTGHLNLFINPLYECHHIDGNKTNDKIGNIAIILKENHKRADFLAEQNKRGKITKQEYLNFLENSFVTISLNGVF